MTFLLPLSHSETLSHPEDDVVNFVSGTEDFRRGALKTIIVARCLRYLPTNDHASCLDAVDKMLKILDFDVTFTHNEDALNLPKENWIPKSFVFIAFKKNLIHLLSNPQTSIYLQKLSGELFKYATGGKGNFNIWDFTKSYFHSDYMAALVLATFFQDTSNMMLHLAYLEKAEIRGNNDFDKNKEYLAQVISSINLILDSSDNKRLGLFYPKGNVEGFNRNIYHYYVPLYLSMELQKWGAQKRFAFTASLMLNLSYEFITSTNDYRFLVTDPENISSESKLKDIFEGFIGSSVGVNKVKSLNSFEFIKKTFKTSTAEGVKLLLKE
jgi:hypothetical protein